MLSVNVRRWPMDVQPSSVIENCLGPIKLFVVNVKNDEINDEFDL